MKPSDAARVLRDWFDRHLVHMIRALAWHGVPAEEQADLAQEALWSAYVALLRMEAPPDKPRAWLGAFCKKQAGNYRQKALRRAAGRGDATSTDASDPEQLVGQRELLILLFAEIDEEAQDIILAVRVGGLTWEELARERGITIDQAKYLHGRAVDQMKEALARWKVGAGERGALLVPLALAELLAAAPRAADLLPDVQRRIWQSLDRRMDGAGAAHDDPDRDRGEPRASPISIQIHTQASPGLVPALAILGSGMAMGLVAGLLLHDRLLGHVPPEPAPASVVATAARVETTYASRDVIGHASGAEEEVAPPPPARVMRGTAITRANRAAEAPAGQQALLDWARAAIDAGDTTSALAKLDEHARRFANGPDASVRRKLLDRACAVGEARRAPACAGGAPR